MHDAVLLQALLDSKALRPHERDAFSSMARRRADGRALSYGQRAWAQDVGARLRLPGVQAVGYTPPLAFDAGKRPCISAAHAKRVEVDAKLLDAELRAWGRRARTNRSTARH